MKLTTIFVLLIFLLGCEKSTMNGMNNTNIPPVKTKQLTYLALGDSYTIGEAVSQDQSFPYQLSAGLSKQGLNVAVPEIIAKTGWTTDELQAAIKAEGLSAKFDFVTLLIGVNNQYRGYPIDTYRTEFRELLQTAISFAGGDKTHVFVVSIPDWGATPFGKQSGRDLGATSSEIDAFNAVGKEEALDAGASFTDITPGSRDASANPLLVASDGLHPSGNMYKNWANNLIPVVISSFK
ncbi:SGNH/GDSL hydrolase family protein [Pedobacter cryoconitis]|nr:SGNH/GDSL hydrolase family protein [Pedobacter cryoconitis]